MSYSTVVTNVKYNLQTKYNKSCKPCSLGRFALFHLNKDQRRWPLACCWRRVPFVVIQQSHCCDSVTGLSKGAANIIRSLKVSTLRLHKAKPAACKQSRQKYFCRVQFCFGFLLLRRLRPRPPKRQLQWGQRDRRDPWLIHEVACRVASHLLWGEPVYFVAVDATNATLWTGLDADPRTFPAKFLDLSVEKPHRRVAFEISSLLTGNRDWRKKAIT